MKRTIKRTEITIETVEITTIRRTQREDRVDESSRNGLTDPPIMLPAAPGPAEMIRQIGIEEKKENDKAR